MISLPIFLAFCFTRQILQAIGQEPDVSEYAHGFVLLSMPKAYLLAMIDLTRLYLGCFKSTIPAMLVQAVATIGHIGWLHFFVVEQGLDLDGIAYASNITTATILIFDLIYARFYHPTTRESYNQS